MITNYKLLASKRTYTTKSNTNIAPKQHTPNPTSETKQKLISHRKSGTKVFAMKIKELNHKCLCVRVLACVRVFCRTI